MITITVKMQRAVNELVDSGAAEYLIERMAVRIVEDAIHSDSMREDREFRARLDNVRGFDGEIQSVLNDMAEEL